MRPDIKGLAMNPKDRVGTESKGAELRSMSSQYELVGTHSTSSVAVVEM
jgi:hypothetical protein